MIRSLTECMIARKWHSFLKSSEVVENAGYALIHLFITAKGDPDPQKLLNQKHIFFIELLKGSKPSAAKVGEVNEQALLALSLLPLGEWMKAVYVCSHVCGGLWSFRGTLANWAHLQGSCYLPLDKPSLQSCKDEGLEVHAPHLASTDTNHGDEVPEVQVPEELDEDDEEDHPAAAEEAASGKDMDHDSIQLVDSIQWQCWNQEILLLKIFPAINYHFAEEESNSLPVVIEE